MNGWLAYAWRRTLHNLPQKLLALVAALGLWFVATGERRATVDRAFTVPLRVIDETRGGAGRRRSPSGLPQNVLVTLSGPRNQLLALSGDEVEAGVNVSGLSEGPFQQPITVRPPAGFRVTRYSPREASGFLDAEITRTVAVQLAVANLPERALPRYSLTPRAVQVTGAQRLVRSVASVATVPVSLPAGSAAEARLIALDAQGDPVTDVRLSPGTVNVQRTDTGELPIKMVAVELPDPPGTLNVVSSEIDPTRVRLLGDPAALGKLSAVTAKVPYRAGRYTARAALSLPDGVRSLETVTVTLEVRERAGARPAKPAKP